MTCIHFMRALAACSVVFTGIGLSGPGHAAEISPQDDPVMNCYLQLDGPLEKGDADRLSTQLDTYAEDHFSSDYPGAPRVCLNSNSGDYAAALDIMDRLSMRFSTAVAAGDTCAGPCALVFMAGRAGDGATVDSDQGGRIVHPKGTLRFGDPGVTRMDKDQIAHLVALQGTYDIHPQIVTAMIASDPAPRTLETVGEAALWQIRVGPSVMPDRLTPLAMFNACTNAVAPLLDRLRFADDEHHNADWVEWSPPTLDTSGSDVQKGQLMTQINRKEVNCKVSYYGAHSLPTGEIALAVMTLGGEEGAKLFRSLYAAMMFTPPTAIATLARADDTEPQKVSVAETSAPDVTIDKGMCGIISDGELVEHYTCSRTITVSPDDMLGSLTRTTFDNGEDVPVTATTTGEYGRSWPREIEPEFTFEGAPARNWVDGMPDAGDEAGNDPGADTACRIATDDQSQWCVTSFWKTDETDDVFLFISDAEAEAALGYEGWD